MMSAATLRIPSTAFVAALVCGVAVGAGAQTVTEWPVHSMDRPQPPVVEPGGFVAMPRPSDAIPLFSGSSLAEWRSADGTRPAPWRVGNNYFEVVPGSGGIA